MVGNRQANILSHVLRQSHLADVVSPTKSGRAIVTATSDWSSFVDRGRSVAGTYGKVFRVDSFTSGAAATAPFRVRLSIPPV